MAPEPNRDAPPGAAAANDTSLAPAPSDTRSHTPGAPSRPADPPRPGLPERFGRYRVLKQLGKGGMGAVYLAHDERLDRQVALKVPSLAAGDADGLARFEREARAAAALNHPNICQVHDVGEVDGVPYLTMTYVRGRSLSDFARAERPVPPARAAALVRKAALALGKAHEHGVVHRDVKPSNVMLGEDGEPVVMDFGLARRADASEARITASGAVLGTPAYMSPEQVAGEEAGPASDVYSLGVVLYELLAGRPPFEGPLHAVLVNVSTADPPRPSELRPGLDPGLESICLKAMAKRPADRYASMGDFAAALAAWEGTMGATALKETTLLPARRAGAESGGGVPWAAVAAAAAAAVLLAAGAVIVIRTKSGETIKVETTTPVESIQVDGKPVAGPAPVVPAVAARAGAAKASADMAAPAPLAAGEVVKGRVDGRSKTKTSNYWLVDLPAGEYKAVVDMERADGRNSNIQGEVQFVGPAGEEPQRLGRFNDTDYRSRGVFAFRLDRPRKALVRVTAEVMMDYHLGVYPAGAPFPVPYFRKTPRVTPLKIGETFRAGVLDGGAADTADAFCSMTLPAGDYTLTVAYRRLDGRSSNIQGAVEAMTPEGMRTKQVLRVNEVDTRASSSARLLLADDETLIFRVSATQKLDATFKVDAAPEK